VGGGRERWEGGGVARGNPRSVAKSFPQAYAREMLGMVSSGGFIGDEGSRKGKFPYEGVGALDGLKLN